MFYAKGLNTKMFHVLHYSFNGHIFTQWCLSVTQMFFSCTSKGAGPRHQRAQSKTSGEERQKGT